MQIGSLFPKFPYEHKIMLIVQGNHLFFTFRSNVLDNVLKVIIVYKVDVLQD